MPRFAPTPSPAIPVHPIQCIVPPYILDAVKLRGNAEEREMAVRLESDCQAFRARRQRAAPPASFRPAARVSATEAKGPRREVYDARHGSSLPATLRRKEGDEPAGDAQVDEAYEARETPTASISSSTSAIPSTERGSRSSRPSTTGATTTTHSGTATRWCTATATGRSSPRSRAR